MKTTTTAPPAPDTPAGPRVGDIVLCGVVPERAADVTPAPGIVVDVPARGQFERKVKVTVHVFPVRPPDYVSTFEWADGPREPRPGFSRDGPFCWPPPDA